MILCVLNYLCVVSYRNLDACILTLLKMLLYNVDGYQDKRQWVCSHVGMQNQERIDAPLHIQIVGTRVCLETSDFDINTHLERVYVPVVSGDLVISISIRKLEHERINKVEVFFNLCFFTLFVQSFSCQVLVNRSVFGF